ncbi:type III-B CRISPR module-associated protein Cmr5 [Thermus tengchongensis]|uniref:CRISPR type III-B/RAMP module-associated protein Cmr5 n=1 Tax=Thermus tengchongensis TaxID=1214928 RepID=A0ABY2K3X8_9DEIN|nr:type III-B CRISPR module-associated protein Cmr5 [Thermus tengchongensis]TFU14830.1 type III-B CRISPR module-associated protein Cmr5 [Thermus tengchongensis]
MRTRSQLWAQGAYERVKEAAQKGGTWAEDYQTMALKFPVLVRQAGLAQALAFVDSRGKEAHKRFLDDLAQVLGRKGGRELAEEALRAELLLYLRLTREVLQASEWFKRFAQALIEGAS